ncbi:hypothetical protein JY97_11855 [Alkalispirochaeta odontotermitis]|nr:hypothetical protein JY97_11855 [Alkalispirochaeta odontotermitis]CAB1084314.1 hypothetical protein D1AOALGA4SA_11838 [Olavius algarvensis Delta 1 endosymbiont]
MTTTRPGMLSIVFLLTMILGACNHQSELEGSWIGCEIHRPILDWTLTIAGNQFSLVREDLNVWYKGFLKLNKNCRLKKIDMEVVDTAELKSTGKTALGIYEVDRETLTIIASKPGGNQRPLSFDESGKSYEFYFTKNN